MGTRAVRKAGGFVIAQGRVSDLVSEEKAAAFCERYPSVEFVDVSGAGHMVAGDRNDRFNAAVTEFLESTVGPRAGR